MRDNDKTAAEREIQACVGVLADAFRQMASILESLPDDPDTVAAAGECRASCHRLLEIEKSITLKIEKDED